VWFEGLIYEPSHRSAKAPLVVLNPGGGYFCEDLIAHGDFDAGQYKNVGGKFLEAGCVIYAPQFLIWHDESAPVPRQFIDIRLKAMGGSITAVEVYNTMHALDYFTSHEEGIDPERIGMMGLSYGGFYALYIAAAETRIKSTFSSCFFCDRFGTGDEPGNCRSDWLWQNAAYTFFDAEVSALIAPHALYIEGNKDDMFPLPLVLREEERLKPFYAAAGAPEKLMFHIGDVGHEVVSGDIGVNFFLGNL